MIAKIKELIWRWRRLRSIEKAIEMRLYLRQRLVALRSERPDLTKWKRASGKTIAACVWVLMWRREPIDFDAERRKVGKACAPSCFVIHGPMAFPDPDAYVSGICLAFTINEFLRLKFKCMDAGIDVCDAYSRSGIIGRHIHGIERGDS